MATSHKRTFLSHSGHVDGVGVFTELGCGFFLCNFIFTSDGQSEADGVSSFSFYFSSCFFFYSTRCETISPSPFLGRTRRKLVTPKTKATQTVRLRRAKQNNNDNNNTNHCNNNNNNNKTMKKWPRSILEPPMSRWKKKKQQQKKTSDSPCRIQTRRRKIKKQTNSDLEQRRFDYLLFMKVIPLRWNEFVAFRFLVVSFLPGFSRVWMLAHCEIRLGFGSTDGSK